MARGEVVLEDGDGLVRLADAGVAHLAVLVAPVGVVHVVAHEVVHLLGGRVRGTALAGRAHEDKAELVRVVELFLNGAVVGEGTVVHALHPVVAAQAGRHVERVGPAVVPGAGGVGHHQAQPVQLAVGEHAPPPSLADGQGVDGQVRQAVVAADAVVGDFGAVDGVLRAGGLVEAAPQGERGVPGDGVVHLDAGQVHVLRLGGITAHAVADGAEVVARHVVEHVILAEQDRRAVAVTGIVHVELHEVVHVHLADDRAAGQGEVEHVLDIPVVDGDVDTRLQVVRSLDHQVVNAVVQVFDEEASVVAGSHRGHFGRTLVQHEDRTGDRGPVGAADDRAAHASRERLGGKAQREEERDGRQG